MPESNRPLVERIARVLDHPVEIRSKPGRGSHFSVAVPLAPALPVGAKRGKPPRIEMIELAELAVLCIDNEPKILDGMVTLLGGWGCHVLKATDLKTALASVSEANAPPSGVLVDYHLDEGNGIEAIAALRWRFGADLPAILITADRSPAVREEARARDIQVLAKPLKPAALRALMAQWRVTRMAAAE